MMSRVATVWSVVTLGRGVRWVHSAGQYSTIADHIPVLEEPADTTRSTALLRDLRDIPGPPSLPGLGISYKLANTPLHLILDEQRRTYGDLFKINLGFGAQALVVSEAGLIEAVYRSEGKYPCRGNTLGLLSEASKQFVDSPILAGVEGEEWKQLRTSLSKPLSPRRLAESVMELSSVAENFINIAESRATLEEDGFVRDILPLLHRWAMEAMSRFMFPQKIPFQHLTNKMADQLTDGIIRQNSYIGKTLFYPLWILKFYRPKAFLKLCEAVKDVYEAGSHFIDDTFKSLQVKDNESCRGKSLLLQWKADKNLSEGEILTNSANVLAGGVDTTANTVSFLLHLVCTHPQVQDRLHEEVVRTVGPDGPVTPAALQNMHYVKGCVKETLRLYPVAPINIRKIDKEVILSNYKIPTNTTYMIPTWSIGRDPKYFEDPLTFKPERWGKDRADKSPFLLQPFGYGPRQCFGRRLAEFEMWTLLAKIMQKHTMTTDNWSELDTTDLILRPNRPINVKLERRPC